MLGREFGITFHNTSERENLAYDAGGGTLPEEGPPCAFLYCEHIRYIVLHGYCQIVAPELSQAAEQLHLSFQQAIDLLEAYNSVVARRSTRLRANPSVVDWEKLHHELQRLRKNYG